MDERSDALLRALHGRIAGSTSPMARVAEQPPPEARQNGRRPAQRVIEPDPHWQSRPLSALSAVASATDWIWEGMLARGCLTLLTGRAKVGKTTFLSHLLSAIGETDTFCGCGIQYTEALVVSEEHEQFWVRRRDEWRLGDHIAVVTKPFLARPDLPTWEAFLAFQAEQLAGGGRGLVVFDSLPNLWPVTDENDAATVLSALMPLARLTEAGAAVLCLMHPSKSDAGEGQAMRGSSATAGYADVLLEMRRYDLTQRDDRRRVLTSYSRFPETLEELVLDYLPAGEYRALGDRSAVARRDRSRLLLRLLPAGSPGATLDDILASWPGDHPKPSRPTLLRELWALQENGDARRTGQGHRSDPYRYSSPEGPD